MLLFVSSLIFFYISISNKKLKLSQEKGFSVIHYYYFLDFYNLQVFK